MVFCGLYPIDTSQYEYFKEAMEKISLSDSPLTYEYETSQELGIGIRCGFLGLLHMDVIQARLFREYSFELIASRPTVIFKIVQPNGVEYTIDSPSKIPDRPNLKHIHRP